MDLLKQKDRIMGIVVVLLVLAVIGSAVGMWLNNNETFSPIDEWPYLPPKYWKEREVTHWDPWYYNNGNYNHPSNPSITNYTVQDYQFPARTLELVREKEVDVPKALPTNGLSEVMAEESNPAEQGLGPTPEEALPKVPEQEMEHYGGDYLGARYRGARYEGMGYGVSKRHLLIGIVIILVAYLVYRNYNSDSLDLPYDF